MNTHIRTPMLQDNHTHISVYTHMHSIKHATCTHKTKSNRQNGEEHKKITNQKVLKFRSLLYFQ